MIEAPPLSLYLHLPWCVRKCPYCDFNSHTLRDASDRDRYVDALTRDIGKEAQRAAGRPLCSIFLGGGTPSLFSAPQVQRILDSVRANFELIPGIEITMEANPGTVECDAPAGYRAAGVNRISVGAQSFSDSSLQLLGRIHSAADIGRAVGDIRDAGVDNVNIDLMYALPGQDVEAALQDIDAAAALDPAHISWYQLTLEPNTVFHARPPAGIPADDAVAEIQERGQQRLSELGYQQYEVSAYARDGRQCLHNLNYWSFGDYLAAGAGAHGKISDGEGIFRYTKPANPLMYMQCIETHADVGALQPVAETDRMFEYMLNVLRLNDGFAETEFVKRTGLPLEELKTTLSSLAARELLIEVKKGHWRPSELGKRFLNDLQASFLQE
ncbi:MAG: radical SAM family heme chaperone HemW [Woeseiaceae bacterium]